MSISLTSANSFQKRIRIPVATSSWRTAPQCGDSQVNVGQIRRYCRSRFPLGMFLPLAMFLYVASLATGWPTSPLSWVASFLFAISLLFQFRLWDDLSDIANDRLDHPKRVLSQASSLTSFRWVLIATFVLNSSIIVLTKPWSGVIAFLMLNAAFLFWYWLKNEIQISDVANYHVVLIKYPVFVLLLGSMESNLSIQLCCAMCLVYLCFCVFEVLHDQSRFPFRRTALLLAFEMTMLQVVAVLLVIRPRHFFEPLAVAQCVLAMIGAIVLMFLFQQRRKDALQRRSCYSIFLLGSALLLNQSLVTLQGQMP